MAKKTLFMETTKIGPEQTVGEIQRILGKYGAGAILTEYEKGEVSGVCFKVNVSGKDIPFKLPARWQSIYEVFVKRRVYPKDYEDKDIQQAKRVAWRQILRWIEAQMALVETNMVKIQEVFMPYIQVNIEGKTLYEQLEEKKFTMLEHKR